ncbi:T6SS effector amidase Tae4 family protein [Sediminibacterium sp. C3]|uniref:T6SS effector amidase Tae4 family protein n=1 Tax=Sediminibacterium sp. C3 TaxID=1267211 RepID=UPI00047BD197|nr:T6SS effector amidase Tae4 family protein [Sediminibacterium sp. C3]
MFLVTSFIFTGCKKTGDLIKKDLPENISKQELLLWINKYQKLMPDGPKPILEQALKTYYKGQMILKMPLSSGGGNLYFTKTDKLYVQFIRIVSYEDQVNKPFTGYYEFIDMNLYTYKKVIFKQGVRQAEVKKENANVDLIQNTSTVKSTETWLGAFLRCLVSHIFAIPRRNILGEWQCYGLGGGSSDPEEVDIPSNDLDGGGGGIDWTSWFLILNPPGSYIPNPIPDLSMNWDAYLGGGGAVSYPSNQNGLQVNLQQKKDYLIQVLNLNYTKQFYLDNSDDLVNVVYDFIIENGNLNSYSLINELIEWIISDPSATPDDLKYFLTIPEPEDGLFDSFYWNDPNLIFQKIPLPTLHQFLEYFPKIINSTGNIEPMRSDSVYALVGGVLGDKYGQPNYKNACAIRASWAFNQIKIFNQYPFRIPNGVGNTEKGANDLSYILSAKAFNSYMNTKFGAPTKQILGTDINSNRVILNTFLKNLRTNNIHGIFSLVTKGGSYTGHVDLLLHGICVGGYNIPADLSLIEKIEIWELD